MQALRNYTQSNYQSSRATQPAKLKLFVYLVLPLVLGISLARISHLSKISVDASGLSESSLARWSQDITVHTQGRSNPSINLSDGREVLTDYEGPAELTQLLWQNQAQPLAMATADFDEDGVPDLITGYTGASSGIITLLRGNVDAIYPNSPEAQQRKAAGTFTDAPFLSPAQVFEAPQSPDFIGAGDFDNDGHWDVVAAKRGNDKLYLLAGDGKGGLSLSREIELPGAAMAMVVGEINRRDGLDDVVVGIDNKGAAQALVFEGPQGALRAKAEAIDLQFKLHTENESFALALGQFDDDYAMDLAAAVDDRLWMVQGRDRKLSLDEATQNTVAPARVAPPLALRSAVKAMTAGYFHEGAGKGLALLLADGSIYLHAPNEKRKDAASEENKYTATGLWSGATGLISVRISGQAEDDLVVVGESDRQLHIASFAEGGALRGVETLNVAGVPATALPMRLNSDALSDLVILQEGRAKPVVVETKARMTFVVNTTADHAPDGCDSKDCTLREAILAANANPGLDAIVFNIRGKAPHIIKLLRKERTNEGASTALIITDPVTIDGSTQKGFNGKPVIEIDHTSTYTETIYLGFPAADNTGITISTSDCTLTGLLVYAKPNPFVIVGGASIGVGGQSGREIRQGYTNNLIEGNYLGIGTDGFPKGDAYQGVYIASKTTRTTVGGTVPAARNVISGVTQGVYSSGASEVLVQGNYIGVDDTGTKAVSRNNDQGTFLFTQAVFFSGKDSTFGGTTAGARNIICVGNQPNIEFAGGGNNLIQGNYIGVNVTGDEDFNNGSVGIVIYHSSVGNMIGGPALGARNVISGYGYGAIWILGKDSTGNTVQNNYIGTDATGMKRLPNGGGIWVFGTGNTYILDNLISGNKENGIIMDYVAQAIDPLDNTATFGNSTGVVAQRNLIGTDSTGKNPLGNDGHGIRVVNKNLIHRIENNTIAFNKGAGIFIPGGSDPGFKITIIGNYIFSNGGIGIALNALAGTRNSDKLPDNLANNGQNFPVLTSVLGSSQNTTVTGVLKSPPPEGFRLEFYSNSKIGGSGKCKPEGKVLLHSEVITPDKIKPDGSFTITLPRPVEPGYINCTATSGVSGIGNTSEFSDCVQTKGHSVIAPSGPYIQEVIVTPEQIVARGFGFLEPVQVFVDGVGFKTQSRLEDASRRLIQTGELIDGRSISAAVPPGSTVRIRFSNSNGGQTEVSFRN